MQNFSGIRFIFLDRDGVINRKAPEGFYVSKWQDFVILPGVEDAIRRCNRAGKIVVVVTNQRGIALGKYEGSDVELLHTQLQQHLSRFEAHVDAFYFCPHDEAECDCRKPKPGMLRQAFRDFPDAQPSNSVMIGDSVSDIQAAQAAGMCAIFIEGQAETRKAGSEIAKTLADAVCGSLPEAIMLLMKDFEEPQMSS